MEINEKALEITKRLKEHFFFYKIRRVPIEYKLEIALEVIKLIGKMRADKFVLDDKNRFLYTNLIRWVHADEEFLCLDPITRKEKKGDLNAGIYVAGGTGTGKSWAMEILSEYTTIDSAFYYFGKDEIGLHFDCKKTDDVCDEFQKTGNIQKYKTKNIICFQDLGSTVEPLESLYMGNRVSVMQAILENRGDRFNQFTLITSNLPFTHELFRKKYHDRVVSRLFEKCNYFELEGKDRRKK